MLTVGEVKEAAKRLLANHRITPDLKAIIVTDPGVKRVITKGFEEVLKEEGFKFTLMTIPSPNRPGQEPERWDSVSCTLGNEYASGKPAEIIAKHDVAFLLTSASLTHTSGSKKIMEKEKGYVVSIPGIDEKVIRLLQVNPEKVKRICETLSKITGPGPNQVQITSESGTDLTMVVPRNNWIKEFGMREEELKATNGVFGEYATAPIIGSARGIYVLPPRSCLTTPIGMTTEEIRLVIANGMVVQIIGKGKEAETLRGILRAAFKKNGNPYVWQIAEFALGANPFAPRIGKSVCVEKKLGGIHIAIGNNNITLKTKRDITWIPGVTAQTVGVHIDCITFGNTVKIDGKVIMEKGKLKLVKIGNMIEN